uniref:C2H2-type domain-containing protein n=1 Tax=Pundamilia nyererei TaxID=303518 RepID=A0A3B4EV82_9CICH
TPECSRPDTKPSLQPEVQNCERDEEFLEEQETRTVQFILPLTLTSSSQTLAQSESVQDGRESERPAASFSSEQTQAPFSTFRESTELPHFNSAAPDCHCHLCNKSFSSSHHLINHAFHVHAGVKLHRCHVCGKECSRKGDLKIHMRIHTGEKPFCCSFCCKSFTHSGHLRKHMRSHTGERPHLCGICGRGFLQSCLVCVLIG